MVDDSRELSSYIHKRVSFRFDGVDLRFALSQGAFSSHDVDEGSKLLLKTIAQSARLHSPHRILDVGCGAGTLAVALAKRHASAEVVAVDRSVFACALTEENARLNEVDCTVRPGLGLPNGDELFDCIVSNFPAKAGTPVIVDFLCRAGGRLTESGRCCVVFVSPLADTVEQAMERCGLEVLHRERTKNHFVLHFRGHGTAATDPFEPYVRTEGSAQFAGFHYNVKTVYGLPEFDTLSFRSELLLDAADTAPQHGPYLFVNPGQGHVPCALLSERPGERVMLASDDVLSLEASRRNLERNGVDSVFVQEIAHVGELETNAPPTVAVVSYDPISSADWMPHLMRSLSSVTSRGGTVLLGATSTTAGRVEKQLPRVGLRLVSSKKYRGQRVLVVKKRR
jgi:16S rRNA G1207 methylase RsmC